MLATIIALTHHGRHARNALLRRPCGIRQPPCPSSAPRGHRRPIPYTISAVVIEATPPDGTMACMPAIINVTSSTSSCRVSRLSLGRCIASSSRSHQGMPSLSRKCMLQRQAAWVKYNPLARLVKRGKKARKSSALSLCRLHIKQHGRRLHQYIMAAA